MNVLKPSFRLIPVLDLLGGRAVHAIRGHRSEYKPLSGKYAPSPDPDEVLLSLEKILPERVAYIADLDQIQKQGDNRPLLQKALQRGWKFWLDEGLTEGPGWRGAGIVPVAGTETILSPRVLKEFIQDHQKNQMVSIDLKGGIPLRSIDSFWPKETAIDLIHRVVELGANRLILLDLAMVGSGAGPAHLDIATRALNRHPDLEIYLGGGIRGPADLECCQKAGLAGALVATALQSGALDAWFNSGKTG